MAISVELGLLPPDTKIESGCKRKQQSSSKNSSKNAARKAAGSQATSRKQQQPQARRRRGRPSSSAFLEDDPTEEGEQRPWKRERHEGPTSASSSLSGAAATPAALTEAYKLLCAEQQRAEQQNDKHDQEDDEDEEGDDDEDDNSELHYERILREPPPEPMDPETSLDVVHVSTTGNSTATTTSDGSGASPGRTAMPTTVHWDPHSPDGAKVGWRIRIAIGGSSGGSAGSTWINGRVTRYDPYTHKHKIVWERNPDLRPRQQPSTPATWIWLRNEQHNLQLATRLVWAHVKGYAWWPALVMEGNTAGAESGSTSSKSGGVGAGGVSGGAASVMAANERVKEGYVQVEFFGTEDVSILRDTSECVRPFAPDSLDPVVAKHKKKRNARAFQLACQEFQVIRDTRNEASIWYARKALDMAQWSGGKHLVGKQVSLHRSNVNYPYGETLTAKVHAYSTLQKKWLLSYDISAKTKNKYDACWIDVFGKKDCSSLKILDPSKKHIDYCTEDLASYVVGFEYDEGDLGTSNNNKEATTAASPANKTHHSAFPQHTELAILLSERCRGCVEYWKKQDVRVACDDCGHEYHLACLDPPLSLEAWQRIVKDETDFLCAKCTPCRGCYQKDIVFGSHPYPKPKTLSFAKGEVLNLCSMCTKAYDKGCFCPNCAHTWDAEKLDKVTSQIEYTIAVNRKRKGNKEANSTISDTALPLILGSFTGDDELPLGAKVDPTFYYPETSEWGYGENEMLVCDECDLWVHAGCAGLDEAEYEKVSDGEHAIYSKEFLCRVCCRQRAKDIIIALQEQDTAMLFASPVTEKVAPNYRDVIKQPMDLQTMLQKAETDEYQNYAWVRELFELMVLNALTFNNYVSG